MRLFAVRAANSVSTNSRAAIIAATTELLEAVMSRNELAPDRLVSCIFTLTSDLDAAFPAYAARQLGFEQVPMLCTSELSVPGAAPRIVRALLHYYAAEDHRPRPAYLGEARALRPDLADG